MSDTRKEIDVLLTTTHVEQFRTREEKDTEPKL